MTDTAARRMTGASEAQIEAGARGYHFYESSDPEAYVAWERLGHRTRECVKEIAESVLERACPPDHRIVPVDLLTEVADALDRGDRSVTLRDRVRRAAG